MSERPFPRGLTRHELGLIEGDDATGHGGGRRLQVAVDGPQHLARLIVVAIVDVRRCVGGAGIAEIPRHPGMTRARSGQVPGAGIDLGRRQAERPVETHTYFYHPGVNDAVGLAGEHVNAAACKPLRRIDPVVRGKIHNQARIVRDRLQQAGSRHARAESEPHQADNTITSHAVIGAAERSASDDTRAHDAGRVRDVQLAGHESA